MAVTFDAVGPTSAGSVGTTSPQTSTHPGSAAAASAVVGVAVDSSGDGSTACSVTYGAQPMTSLKRWECGGSAQSSGFLQVFALDAPPGGSQSVVITVTGSFAKITAGSLTFLGSAATVLATATPGDSAGANVTSGSLAVPSASASNMVACLLGTGSGGVAWTAGTSRFATTTGAAVNACNYCAGATAAGTGGSVTFSWTMTSDFYAAIGVEVQVPSGTDTSPAWAATATDLGGGSGSWASTGNADGVPDGSVATWTAP
jgi:hypothetical protein